MYRLEELADPRATAPFIVAVFFKKQRDPKFLPVCFTTEREGHDYVAEHEQRFGDGYRGYKVIDMSGADASPDFLN